MKVRFGAWLALCSPLLGVAGCEEINHVRVVAPRVLEGANVTVQGPGLRAKLAHVQSDSTVETDVDIPLPPLDATLVIEREGSMRRLPPRLGGRQLSFVQIRRFAKRHRS